MKTVFTYWLLAFALTSFAQGDIAVGTWRVHLSYNDIRHLGVTDEKIFAAERRWQDRKGSRAAARQVAFVAGALRGTI